jgi:hypothetical protein
MGWRQYNWLNDADLMLQSSTFISEVPYIWCLIFGATTTFVVWLWGKRGKGHKATDASGLAIILADTQYNYFFTRKVISLVYAIVLSWFYANVYLLFISRQYLLQAIAYLFASLIVLLIVRVSSEGLIAMIKIAENTTHLKIHVRDYMYGEPERSDI